MPRDSLNSIVAKNVRRFRHQLGISQEDLAERAQLHRTYIGAIERCERNITLDTLQRIAIALGISAVSLLTPSSQKREPR